MRTILVPVDFSKTSENAALFAACWSRDFDYQHIILLRNIQNSVFVGMLPSKEQADSHHQFLEGERELLQQFSKPVMERAGLGVKVSLATSEEPMLRSILQVMAEQEVDLVAVSSEHENVIDLAKASPVRVLIVPSGRKYMPVKTILVPFDFKSFESLEKIGRYMPQAARSAERDIIVLNVDPDNRHLADELFIGRENNLHEYLRDFRHEIFFSGDTDILQGIMSFVDGHLVDLIVALPGKHSFLYNLTHKNISTALYRQATRAVLILK
jgi:nucleotide-binding universal stress UspA family protein